jgi:hypothetical protein
MKIEAIKQKTLIPELEEKRNLARLDLISMDFAEKHKLEWNNLKMKEKLERLLNENRRLKMEHLETKRFYLESVKETNFLRHQLDTHVGKSRRKGPSFYSK